MLNLKSRLAAVWELLGDLLLTSTRPLTHEEILAQTLTQMNEQHRLNSEMARQAVLARHDIKRQIQNFERWIDEKSKEKERDAEDETTVIRLSLEIIGLEKTLKDLQASLIRTEQTIKEMDAAFVRLIEHRRHIYVRMIAQQSDEECKALHELLQKHYPSKTEADTQPMRDLVVMIAIIIGLLLFCVLYLL
jgi:hypothetical protein